MSIDFCFTTTNAFEVRDPASFREWCAYFSFIRLKTNAKTPSVFTVVFEEMHEPVSPDFFQEMASFLKKGHVMVIMGFNITSHRPLDAWAIAINSKGERKSLALSDIYVDAVNLGFNCNSVGSPDNSPDVFN